ncbi:MAG: terpene cyclase/mutase family protein [Verrucomicrobiales bacterium]|nr:terpene cyclase/mutase family protein [Verrucomicrobiales bacterium]
MTNPALPSGSIGLRIMACLALLVLSCTFYCPAEEKQVATRKPPAAGEIKSAMQRGVDFLITSQNKDGSWGSARNTKGLNIFAPVPGAHHAFRAAVTSLCLSSLIETNAEEGNVKAKAAIRRAEEWMLTNLGSVRRATGDAIYNVWGHSYGIAALVLMHEKTGNASRKARIKKVIEHQIKMLEKYESVDGGWGYYDFRYQAKQPSSSSISFTNATALVALKDAAKIGINVPDRLVKRAVASIKRQRKPDFSYAYGEYLKLRPMAGINRPGGSLGRSQACNIALRYWGDEKVTDQVLDTWLDRLWARNGWLSIGRKRPIPHESWFAVAGYFFYYGHYYAALCLEDLKDSKNAAHHGGQLAAIIVPLQEKDGSWWDYPLYSYHRPYGTAFALMTLQRCLPQED